MENPVSTRLTPAELRKFGLAVGAAFLVLALIAWWRGHPVSMRVLGGLGGALVIGGALAPRALRPAYVGWMSLANILSRITTPVFLGIVYFLMFLPVGLFRRLIGKDALNRSAIRGSYFIVRAERANASMERLF
jgi:hypothetical protein